LFGPFSKVPGTAETNVAVGIRGRIVQVQSEDAGVGSVVPITAALEGPHALSALSLALRKTV